jgi:hypothetical protein
MAVYGCELKHQQILCACGSSVVVFGPAMSHVLPVHAVDPCNGAPPPYPDHRLAHEPASAVILHT